MSRRKDVAALLRGQTVERLLRGEFYLSEGLCRALTGQEGQAGLVSALALLNFDFYGVKPQYPDFVALGSDHKGRQVYRDCWGRTIWRTPQGRRQIVAYPLSGREEIPGYSFPDASLVDFPQWEVLAGRDIFLFGVVDGVFQTAARTMDLLDFLELLEHNPDAASMLLGRAARHCAAVGARLLQLGVDGILVADDVAHYGGLFCSREAFFQIVAPCEEQLFAQALRMNRPVVFHSDGSIGELLDWLAGAAVNGLHSLEPLPRMNYPFIMEKYGRQLVLMGGVDLAALSGTDWQQVRNAVASRVKFFSRARYVLSSTNGFLTEDVGAKLVKTVYRFDEECDNQ